MRRVSLLLQKDVLNLQGASKRLKSVRMSRWCAGTSRVDGCCLVRQGENAEQFLKPSYNAKTGNKNEKKGKKSVWSHQAESGGGVEQKKPTKQNLITKLIKRQKECQSLWTQKRTVRWWLLSMAWLLHALTHSHCGYLVTVKPVNIPEWTGEGLLMTSLCQKIDGSFCLLRKEESFSLGDVATGRHASVDSHILMHLAATVIGVRELLLPPQTVRWSQKGDGVETLERAGGEGGSDRWIWSICIENKCMKLSNIKKKITLLKNSDLIVGT